VRNLPICCPSAHVYSGSLAASAICTTRCSSATRPVIDPRLGKNGWLSTIDLNSGEYPNAVAAQYSSPSRRMMVAISASHSRAAVSTNVSRTG
jgi:hypothetical protein